MTNDSVWAWPSISGFSVLSTNHKSGAASSLRRQDSCPRRLQSGASTALTNGAQSTGKVAYTGPTEIGSYIAPVHLNEARMGDRVSPTLRQRQQI